MQCLPDLEITSTHDTDSLSLSLPPSFSPPPLPVTRDSLSAIEAAQYYPSSLPAESRPSLSAVGPSPGSWDFSRLPHPHSSSDATCSGLCRYFEGDYFKYHWNRSRGRAGGNPSIWGHTPCLTWFSNDSYIYFKGDLDKEALKYLSGLWLGSIVQEV